LATALSKPSFVVLVTWRYSGGFCGQLVSIGQRAPGQKAYRGRSHVLVRVITSARRDIFHESTSQSVSSIQHLECQGGRTGTSFFFNLDQAAEVSRCKRGCACASYRASSKQDCPAQKLHVEQRWMPRQGS
jgi:hypothetical protein